MHPVLADLSKVADESTLRKLVRDDLGGNRDDPSFLM